MLAAISLKWGNAFVPRDSGAHNIRTEKVITISRCVLAVGGLIGAYLDPAQPAQGAIGYVFLAVYVVFSTALLATLRAPLSNQWNIAAHVVEVGLVCFIIVVTDGPTSPFFVYFTFVLFVATLRWRWRGALISGTSLSLVLIVLTVSHLVTNLPVADIDRLVLRNLYLLVASALFAVLGDHLGRSHQQQERLMLAQELHDGALQTLTAVGLKLRAVLSEATEQQRSRLLEIGHLLNEEQRHIRNFVEDSRGGARFPLNNARLPAIAADFTHFVERLGRLWNCRVEFMMSGADGEITSGLRQSVQQIIAEAVANAAVHGGAQHIVITLARERKMLVLTIKDNGAGLEGAHGVYDHAQLMTNKIGPRSLRERVTRFSGSIRLTSTPHGVELHIQLPT